MNFKKTRLPAYSLQGLSGKWKWGRQMARPWKPSAWCKFLIRATL